jgi:hypothetical protein
MKGIFLIVISGLVFISVPVFSQSLSDPHRLETGFNAYSMLALFQGYSYTIDFSDSDLLSLSGVIEIPALLWLSKGSINGLRIKAGAEYSYRFPFLMEAGIGLFPTCMFQSQLLGYFQTLGVEGRIFAGIFLANTHIGVFADIQCSLLTFVQLSSFSLSAFDDRVPGSVLPTVSGVITLTSFNTIVGLYGYFDIGGGTVLKTELGMKFTPSEYVDFGGGMMFGLLPFHLTVSLSYGI